MNILRNAVSPRIILGSLLLLAASSAREVFAQTGSFTGTVFTELSEKPLANAEIVFSDLKRAVRSDSSGNFLFNGLPLGKHSVVVRLVGYEPITSLITLVDAKPLVVDLFLKQSIVVLNNVEVKATAPRYAARLVDFEERRKIGSGRFLTAEFFEQQGGRPLTSFLKQKIPGINFVRGQLATNARSLKLHGDCFVQIILNGLAVRSLDLDREINSLDVIGFEFYTTATTPSQYNGTRGTSGCGTAIIWTK